MKNELRVGGLLMAMALLNSASLIASGRGAPRVTTRPVPSAPARLELPSFSIFGFPSIKDKILDRPFSAKELEELLKAAQEGEADEKRLRLSSSQTGTYSFIPMVFYRSRHLFKEQVWTQQDREEGAHISDFFSRLMRRPDLKIEESKPKSFRKSLLNLRNWFAALCRDNKTLSAMMFTFDEGPFLGPDISKKQLIRARRLATTPLPRQGIVLVLMTDGKGQGPVVKGNEPLIIGAVNKNNTLLWAKRFRIHPEGTIGPSTLKVQPLTRLEGYGYKCYLSVEGTYASARSTLYLDERLNFRFYFLSW